MAWSSAGLQVKLLQPDHSHTSNDTHGAEHSSEEYAVIKDGAGGITFLDLAHHAGDRAQAYGARSGRRPLVDHRSKGLCVDDLDPDLGAALHGWQPYGCGSAHL